MTTKLIEKPVKHSSARKRLVALLAVFALIFVCILVIRCFPTKESTFVDQVAGQIQQEMAENQIVLSSKGVRRTVADFKEPILLTHGKESRLIVHTARLSETMSIASEGLGGWEWTSAYQDIVYEGDAQYTVDLSRLSEEDFERSRRILYADYITGFDATEDIAQSLITYAMDGVELFDFIPTVKSITLQEITQLMKTCFDPSRFVLSVVSPLDSEYVKE